MGKQKGDLLQTENLTALIWCDILHFYYRERKWCLCGRFERRSYQSSGERIAKESQEMDSLLRLIDKAKDNFEEYCSSSDAAFIKSLKLRESGRHQSLYL